MTDQSEMFSKSLKSKSRNRWTNSILEETIVKVIRDGLNACRIPNYRVRERIVICPRCRGFVGRPSEEGVPDIIGWVPKAARMKVDGTSESLALGGVAIPLFVEVKRPKGGIETECQKQFIERANKDGGIAMFARGWDQVADTLRQRGVKLPDGV